MIAQEQLAVSATSPRDGSLVRRPLLVIETHPVQYHAPVYRELESRLGIPVTAIYGSDFSVAGYRDPEFGASFRWDTDLLSGHTASFLSTVAAGGARTADRVSTRGLYAALRAAEPGAILLTGYSPSFYQMAWMASRRARRPLLMRAETTDHGRDRAVPREWLRSAALTMLYRSCTRLLYVGQRSHDHFKRLGIPEQKLLFSPYCVDTTAFDPTEESRALCRPAARRRLGIRDAEYLILFSGKFSERKAPDLLLRAVKSLPPGIRGRITVAFLGSGELQAALEQLAECSPKIATRFLGFQNQTQLSPYYHAADLLVLPSLHSETWGLVVNEALHHGVPCVVSEAVGCAPDLVEAGVTGEMAATGSADSLAAAIERALPLVGLPEIRQRCRNKVSGYTVQKAAQGIAQAYWAVTENAEVVKPQ
jgi:glycosyltransferase involved in cell wall biosynthesis